MNIANTLKRLSIVDKTVKLLKRVVLPGFDGIPIYDVLRLFIKGLANGALSIRASSIAYNFFLAIFPMIIFFFTIIPYIPIDNFHELILNSLKGFLPGHAFDTIKETIEDILVRQRGGLLSIGFIMALFFSTSGINSIIAGFNASSHTTESRNWIKQRLVSLYLVIILSVLVIISTAMISINGSVLSFFMEKHLLYSSLTYYLIMFSKWLILLTTIYFSSSLIYHMGSAKKERFRFFSAGSTLAVILVILTSTGFNFYISNFSKYNALYGSLGTLIILLLWLYLNATVLLLGFELNMSIRQAKEKP